MGIDAIPITFMNLKLNIPYVPSRGFECGQACVAMLIKFFNHKPNYFSIWIIDWSKSKKDRGTDKKPNPDLNA